MSANPKAQALHLQQRMTSGDEPPHKVDPEFSEPHVADKAMLLYSHNYNPRGSTI